MTPSNGVILVQRTPLCDSCNTINDSTSRIISNYSALFSADDFSITLFRLLQRRAGRPGDTVENFTCALPFGLDVVRLDLFGNGAEVRTNDE
jgi:hypothetical protein